jgi:hypothetical protein
MRTCHNGRPLPIQLADDVRTTLCRRFAPLRGRLAVNSHKIAVVVPLSSGAPASPAYRPPAPRIVSRRRLRPPIGYAARLFLRVGGRPSDRSAVSGHVHHAGQLRPSGVRYKARHMQIRPPARSAYVVPCIHLCSILVAAKQHKRCAACCGSGCRRLHQRRWLADTSHHRCFQHTDPPHTRRTLPGIVASAAMAAANSVSPAAPGPLADQNCRRIEADDRPPCSVPSSLPRFPWEGRVTDHAPRVSVISPLLHSVSPPMRCPCRHGCRQRRQRHLIGLLSMRCRQRFAVDRADYDTLDGALCSVRG